MIPLTLEIFVKAAADNELGKYLVLAALQRYSDNFNRNRLFPDIAELSEIVSQLQIMRNGKNSVVGLLPAPPPLFHDEPAENLSASSNSENDSFFDFIDWAYPQLFEKLEEGKAIYDYVQSSLFFREIGITPVYDKEGYLLIPDNKSNLLQVFSFRMSFIILSAEKSGMLKTKFIRYVEPVNTSSEEIKIELLREFTELPNPVTLKCDTDLDYPFQETILPVVKRKLIGRYAA